jgi:rubrerythrin
MDIDGRLRGPHTRRRFIRAWGAGAAGAALLGGCADDRSNLVESGPDESDAADVELLNVAVDLEHRAVAAYKAVAGTASGAALRAIKLVLEQEQEHVDGLAAAIRDLGGTPNRARHSYELPRWRSQAQALRFAIALEDDAIAAYIDALPKLTDRDLRATATSILTNEAEHIALLRGALGEPQVPAAFVTGRPS